MVRLAVRIVTIVLAAYGAGTLGLRALTADRSDGDGVWTLHAYPSPDGAMKAVVTIYEGGHFLAPYCNSGVSVLPIGASDGKAKAAALQVFSGICGNFKGVGGVSPPNVRWLDSKRLTIDFPTRFNEGQSKTEYVLANLDASKQISVSYSAHE